MHDRTVLLRSSAISTIGSPPQLRHLRCERRTDDNGAPDSAPAITMIQWSANDTHQEAQPRRKKQISAATRRRRHERGVKYMRDKAARETETSMGLAPSLDIKGLNATQADNKGAGAGGEHTGTGNELAGDCNATAGAGTARARGSASREEPHVPMHVPCSSLGSDGSQIKSNHAQPHLPPGGMYDEADALHERQCLEVTSTKIGDAISSLQALQAHLQRGLDERVDHSNGGRAGCKGAKDPRGSSRGHRRATWEPTAAAALASAFAAAAVAVASAVAVGPTPAIGSAPITTSVTTDRPLESARGERIAAHSYV